MSEIMHPILEFEAAKGAFITLNFFGAELSRDDRETLYLTRGELYPEGWHLLAQAEDWSHEDSSGPLWSI